MEFGLLKCVEREFIRAILKKKINLEKVILKYFKELFWEIHIPAERDVCEVPVHAVQFCDLGSNTFPSIARGVAGLRNLPRFT